VGVAACVVDDAGMPVTVGVTDPREFPGVDTSVLHEIRRIMAIAESNTMIDFLIHLMSFLQLIPG
jgi:hypothetical protein